MGKGAYREARQRKERGIGDMNHREDEERKRARRGRGVTALPERERERERVGRYCLEKVPSLSYRREKSQPRWENVDRRSSVNNCLASKRVI